MEWKWGERWPEMEHSWKWQIFQNASFSQKYCIWFLNIHAQRYKCIVLIQNLKLFSFIICQTNVSLHHLSIVRKKRSLNKHFKINMNKPNFYEVLRHICWHTAQTHRIYATLHNKYVLLAHCMRTIKIRKAYVWTMVINICIISLLVPLPILFDMRWHWTVDTTKISTFYICFLFIFNLNHFSASALF